MKTRASGALAGSWSDKNSELPKCVSYSENRRGSWSGTKSGRLQRSPLFTYAYWADGGRQPLVRAFLGGGLDYPREEEGLMAAAANRSRAYWAPSSPSRSEATSVEGGCSNKPEGGSPTTQKHFDRRLPTKGPICQEPTPQD
jgi:hypothetical protein